MRRLPAAVCAAALLCSRTGFADPGELTLDQALRLARERAPAAAEARGRVAEARGRLAGASVLLRENPVLEGALGPRLGPQRTSLEAELGLTQSFELGGGRGARIAQAEADLAREQAAGDDVLRGAQRAAAAAFLAALHAAEQVRLAQASEEVAAEILRIAERRLQAGDIPRLDVNLARAALSRARSDVRAANAGRAAALGRLRESLGLGADEPLAPRGRLMDRARHDLATLVARAAQRADLRELEAGRAEATAAARAGDAHAWPGLGVGVRYAREEEADIVLGSLSLTLPLFERGQGARAEAESRASRLGLALEARRRSASLEVRTAHEVFLRRAEAADELEQTALPLLDENEALARRAYEAGQLGLPELLTVRREIAGTRREHLDRQLEAALAGIELEAAAGVLP